jgi:hypothetical protein
MYRYHFTFCLLALLILSAFTGCSCNGINNCNGNSHLPRLQTSYDGTANDRTKVLTFPLHLNNLAEDQTTGAFSATMIMGNCPGKVSDGRVIINNTVTFTFHANQQNPLCTFLEADFNGKLDASTGIPNRAQFRFVVEEVQVCIESLKKDANPLYGSVWPTDLP